MAKIATFGNTAMSLEMKLKSFHFFIVIFLGFFASVVVLHMFDIPGLVQIPFLHMHRQTIEI
jgi:hypothetical protein